jgi:multidrug transporter EmrE-like cation transporter
MLHQDNVSRTSVICLFYAGLNDHSGVSLVFLSTTRPTTAVLVCSQIFVGIGGAIIITASYVAVQASVPHQDMAIAVAVLNLWSSIGSSISIAISSTVWNREVPANLEKYVGHLYNAAERAAIFGDIYTARKTEPRDLIKQGKSFMNSTPVLIPFLTNQLISIRPTSSSWQP